MLLRAFLVAILTLAAAIAASAEGSAPFQLPTPTGRNAVGTVALHLIDRSRWDPLAPKRQRRQLMVQVWYPAGSPRGGSGAAYVEPRVAQVIDREFDKPGALEAVRTHAYVNAPLAKAMRPFPVILYSHGYGSWRNASTALVEELVSRGFVVVTIDHSYDALAVEFPNGTIAHFHSRRADPAKIVRMSQWDAFFAPQLIVRVADVRFVLDALTSLNRGQNPDAEHRALPAHLAGALDLSRIGMFGHSLGGTTTIAVMRQDRRVRAGLLMDSPIPKTARSTGFDRSVMLIRSQNMTVGKFIVPSWQAFSTHLTDWHREILMPGTDHNDFTDLALIARHFNFSQALRSALQLGPIDAQRALNLERSYLTTFFSRTLP